MFFSARFGILQVLLPVESVFAAFAAKSSQILIVSNSSFHLKKRVYSTVQKSTREKCEWASAHLIGENRTWSL